MTGRMQAAAGRMGRSSCEFLQVRYEMTYVLQATMTNKNRECSRRESKRKGCIKRSKRDSERERRKGRKKRKRKGHYRQISSCSLHKKFKALAIKRKLGRTHTISTYVPCCVGVCVYVSECCMSVCVMTDRGIFYASPPRLR